MQKTSETNAHTILKRSIGSVAPADDGRIVARPGNPVDQGEAARTLDQVAIAPDDTGGFSGARLMQRRKHRPPRLSASPDQRREPRSDRTAPMMSLRVRHVRPFLVRMHRLGFRSFR